jgi:PII-like signaling protein
MTPNSDATLLRIYCGEAARHEGGPLYEAIVIAAREAGLAGATVLRGPMGFGHSSHIHTANILRLSADLPVVVEIVDERAKIEAFLPAVEAMLPTGLVTVEQLTVVRYGPRAPA